MTRLESLCYAIQKQEGWAPGTRAWRNNNPGNLRSSPLTKQTQDGYAFFGTFLDGWSALWLDLWIKCAGRSKTGLTHNSTLADFAAIYAPQRDGNDPGSYARNIAATLGVPTTTPLSYFLHDLQ